MTLADKNNNPGNLKDPSTGQFRVFSTPQEGYAALLNDLQIKKTSSQKLGPNKTLADFSQVYAPASDNNNPAQYTANIANHMGVRPDAKLSELDVGKWADAISHAEGYTAAPKGTQTQQSVSSGQTATTQKTTPPGALLMAPKKLNKSEEVAKGFVKGVGGSLLDMARIGETVANQTAGRVVSGLMGRGFRPMSAEERGNEMQIGGTQAAESADEALKSENKYQTYGKVAEAGAEFLIPAGAGKKVLEAKRLARAGMDALDIVAPKETAKVLKEALKQGRTKVEGFFRNVTMSPDQRTERAAAAIEDLVKAKKVRVGATASENANAVRDEISVTAEGLVNQLKGQEIKYILSPQELEGLYKTAIKEIGENPTMVGNAQTSAERILQKFQSFLPKGRDVTAEDLLDARKNLDRWIRSIKGDTIFDPATENAMSIALRSVRQGANDLIALKAPDVAVKEALAKQSALYDALENIASKGAKEVGSSGPQRLLAKHPLVKTILKEGAKGLVPFGAGALLFRD